MGGGGGGTPGEGPRGVPGGIGAVQASQLAKKSQNKTPGVFFQAAFDFDAPGPQNITQKTEISKN